jgi:hypothetical protein
VIPGLLPTTSESQYSFSYVGGEADDQSWDIGARSLAHAAVGCVSAQLSSANCGKGALAAGASEYLGSQVLHGNEAAAWGSGEMYAQTAKYALIGGLSSRITGGSFSEGFSLGAAGYLFNHFGHISKVDHSVPPDAVIYLLPDDAFFAPPSADWDAVYAAGVQDAPTLRELEALAENDSEGGGAMVKYASILDDRVGHFGDFDFQRDDGTFRDAYIQAANVAVGVYLAGAGFSLDQATSIFNDFHNMFSTGAPGLEWMKEGWNAATQQKLPKSYP